MNDSPRIITANGKEPKLELLPENFDLLIKLLETHKHETQYLDLWTKMIWMRLYHAVAAPEGET